MKKRMVVERQRAEARGNREGAQDWELYAEHRRHTTDAALALAPPGGRAAFLGAGNCNDLDLGRLADVLAEIHLVDVDAQALARAADRQPPEVRQKLQLHGGVELTGLLARLSNPRRAPANFAAAESALGPATDAILGRLPRDLDLAVSCSLITQLFFAITRAVPAHDPMLASLRQAAMVIHLRTLAGLVQPGRPILLVSDVISDETYPVTTLPTDGPLTLAVERLADEGIVFEASNPVMLRRILRRDVGLRALLVEPRITAAWIWTGPLERSYLVYAMTAHRRG